MKQIVLFFAVLLSPFIANSQNWRYADLKVAYVSPEAKTIVQSPQFIPVTFRVYNLGPDTILPTDTVRYALAHSFDANGALRNFALNQNFLPGDSIDFNDSVWVNSSKTKSNFMISFVHVLQMFGPDVGKKRLQEEFEVDRHDNRPTLQLFHRGSVGIEDATIESISIFPNPVKHGNLQVRSESSLEGLTVKVYGIRGEVQSIELRRLNQDIVELNVKKLPNGIYFVELQHGHNILIKKILVCQE